MADMDSDFEDDVMDMDTQATVPLQSSYREEDPCDTPVYHYDDDGTGDGSASEEQLEQQIQEDVVRTLEIQNNTLQDSSFFLVMPDSKAVKKFMAAIGVILKECTWTVVKEADFQGIRTKSINYDRTCYVIADLSCKVLQHTPKDSPHYNSQSNSFTVYMENLRNALKPIKPNCMVSMRSGLSNNYLEIYAMNPENFSFSYDCMLKTLEDDTEMPEEPPAMDYDFHITMETKELADIMNYAKDNNAAFFTVRIQECSQTASDEEIRRTIFQIEGDQLGQNHKFYSRKQTVASTGTDAQDPDDGRECRVQMQLRTTVEAAQWPTDDQFRDVYCATFSASLFRDFLRSIIEQPRISLRMHEGKPMIIKTPLGGDGSKIHYFICEKTA